MTATTHPVKSIMSIAATHVNETAYIVGRGPSLRRITADTFKDFGPVIVLNLALDHVRHLYRDDDALPFRVYSQQKDGCVAHDWRTPRDEAYAPDGHVCSSPWVVEPRWPETLIVSAAESPYCRARYERRYVVDVESDLNLPWHTMSAPVAARIAIILGVSKIVAIGFDSWTRDDTRTVEGDALVDNPHAGYRLGAVMLRDIAADAGVPVVWAE